MLNIKAETKAHCENNSRIYFNDLGLFNVSTNVLSTAEEYPS